MQTRTRGVLGVGAVTLACAAFALLHGGTSLLSPAASRDATGDVNAEFIETLKNVRSVSSIDRILKGLLDAPNAQTNAETLVEGWGRYGCWYDLAVTKLLWEHLPSGRLSVEPIIPIVQSRIRERPSLNRQVFWYIQWRDGPRELSDICRTLPLQLGGDRFVGADEFRPLLYIAGLTNSPDWLLHAEIDNLHVNLYIQGLEFLANRPFLRYDRTLGHYVVNEKAKQEQRYLKTALQRTTTRATPLPVWDSPVVPNPPPRERVGANDGATEVLQLDQ